MSELHCHCWPEINYRCPLHNRVLRVDRLVSEFRTLPLHGDAGCDKLTDAEWEIVADAALSIIEGSPHAD